MCAVTLETVYTVADVLPVMAVVKGFAAPNLLELAILHLLSLAVPLLTFPLHADMQAECHIRALWEQ